MSVLRNFIIRSFPSYLGPLFQNTSLCKAFEMKFVYLFIHSFIYLFIYLFIHLFIYLFIYFLHENKHLDGTHFHMNGFPLTLDFLQREKATRKWFISFYK